MGCKSSSRGLDATKHPFLLRKNSLINYLVHSNDAKHGLLTKDDQGPRILLSKLVRLGATADPKGSISRWRK